MGPLATSHKKNCISYPHVQLMSQMAPFCLNSWGHLSLHPDITLADCGLRGFSFFGADKILSHHHTPQSSDFPSSPAPQLSARNADAFPHLSLRMPQHRATNKGTFQSWFSPANLSWFSLLRPFNGPFLLVFMKAWR